MYCFEIEWPCHYRRYIDALLLDFIIIIQRTLKAITQLTPMVGGEGNGLGTELITLKFGIFEGVTSNTDAAQLAEIFEAAKCPTKVNNACDFFFLVKEMPFVVIIIDCIVS